MNLLKPVTACYNQEVIELVRVFEFSASHRLFRPEWSAEENQRVFGKCANPNGHGHNYRLEVVITGTPDPQTGMIMNASRLDEIVQAEIVVHLDHHDLNRDVAWLEGKLPTTEILVSEIWDRLEPLIQARGVELSKIVLWETRKICAIRSRR